MLCDAAVPNDNALLTMRVSFNEEVAFAAIAFCILTSTSARLIARANECFTNGERAQCLRASSLIEPTVLT